MDKLNPILSVLTAVTVKKRLKVCRRNKRSNNYILKSPYELVRWNGSTL